MAKLQLLRRCCVRGECDIDFAVDDDQQPVEYACRQSDDRVSQAFTDRDKYADLLADSKRDDDADCNIVANRSS
jgi:hypothetical protein